DGSAAKPGLLRELGFLSAFCMVAGSIIGTGVFLVASDMSTSLPAPTQALSAWVVAGILSLFGGLIFSELGAMFPGTGGQYLFLREAFGPIPGFLYGWTLFSVIQSGTIAAVAIGFAKFLSGLTPLSPTAMNLAASLAIAVFTGINLLGVRKGAQVLDAVTTFKIAVLVLLAGAGMLLSSKTTESFGSFAGFQAPAFGVALVAAFWSYDGWSNLCFVAGELKNPQRIIPLAMFAGITAVAVVYIGANVAYYRMMPVAAIKASTFVAADAVRVMAGPGAVKLMSVAVMLSALGCLNAMILAGARVVFAMADHQELPPSLAYVHPTYRVPTNALFLQGAWSILLVWSGRYDQLFTYVMGATLFFYGLTASAVVVLRKARPNAERPYKTPAYPILPAIYIFSMLAIVLNTFVQKPKESFAGLGIVLLGLPVYAWTRQKSPVGETAPTRG
ncbi:MAG TPA: amino acid permease, partial [Elusimicrobiota bacterium]|nr:amino acid permease [Elusimicrobiota bacterium]